MSKTPFVHLHVHSTYSLAEGTIAPKELAKLCRGQDMPAVAVTDTNNLFGALEFAQAAAEQGVQPIIGCQVLLGAAHHELVLLVQNEDGYHNLSKLISDAYLDSDGTSAPFINEDELAKYAEGLIALSGGLTGPLNAALRENNSTLARERAEWLQGVFGDRFYIELQRHGWAEEDYCEQGLLDIADDFAIALVATNDCYFPQPDMYEAHDALLCIAGGRYISESDRRRVTREHYLKNGDEMAELFADVPEAVNNTLQIAKRCSYLLQEIDPILPPYETDEADNEAKALRKQAARGLDWRLENFVVTQGMDEAERKELREQYYERLEYEHNIIERMGYPGYFLIVADFIQWAKNRDIPVGPGRGSGAGSLIAWAMQITDLDPLRFGLLFERFLNPERVSMPDFDVDFCQERRDEVISYVQEKYGADKVAQIITFGKLQARAVVRDVGRVLQMPFGQVDKIAKMIPNNPAAPTTLEEALEQDPDLRAERDRDETTGKLISVALRLEGMYRHASTHAAGVVIGDRPLYQLVPLYRDPRSEMPVTQFNMKYVEQAGLVKFDFLGLKTLTVIQKTLELVKKGGGPDIDILQIPFDDGPTFELLAEGATVGVFQLESSGMRDVMRRLRPDRFEEIIALVSLYRPGPMDNIPSYLARKHGDEEVEYLHPLLEPILSETYGIMIYQEQVMQAAQALAGYSLGEADLLRRAMGKKIQSAMDAEREKFVAGCKQYNDIDSDQANAIFDQIAKFAGYGFNKSHAAAYALIAYQTAWLKANYPVEFMAASMTFDMANTDKLAEFKQELQRMEIELRIPDINASQPVFDVEDGAIRYALAALKGVGEQAMQHLVEEREANGIFQGLDDFVARMDPKSMNRKQIEQLAAAGAFESLEPCRSRVHRAADMLVAHANTLRQERETGQNSLFGDGASGGRDMPTLPEIGEWDPLEKLSRECDAVGFYLSAHPLDTRRGQLEKQNIVFHVDLPGAIANKVGGYLKMAGVLLKKQEKISPKTGNRYAFLQLSDPTGFYETVIFAETLQASKHLLEPGKALLLEVDAEMRDDQPRITTQSVWDLDDALQHQRRDIHISLAQHAAIEPVRTTLEAAGQGNARIHLICQTADAREVTIKLPGGWGMHDQTRTALYQIGGVAAIMEE